MEVDPLVVDLINFIDFDDTTFHDKEVIVTALAEAFNKLNEKESRSFISLIM